MSAPTRAKWKHAGKAKEFHSEHNYARYAMVFFAFIERAMLDKELPPMVRVMLAGFRFAWGHLSGEVVDHFPPVNPGDLEQRPLSQKELAGRIGMPASTFSDCAVAYRETKYWRGDEERVYLENPSLFAHERGPRPKQALKNPGAVRSCTAVAVGGAGSIAGSLLLCAQRVEPYAVEHNLNRVLGAAQILDAVDPDAAAGRRRRWPRPRSCVQRGRKTTPLLHALIEPSVQVHSAPGGRHRDRGRSNQMHFEVVSAFNHDWIGGRQCGHGARVGHAVIDGR